MRWSRGAGETRRGPTFSVAQRLHALTLKLSIGKGRRPGGVTCNARIDKEETGKTPSLLSLDAPGSSAVADRPGPDDAR